jgi:lysophospholipase L1-like esterase
MTTFTALGDSITLGIGDPVRGRCRVPDQLAGPQGDASRPWRGWAALLADGLIDPELHVLAGSGACARQIEREQLPRALSLRPDIASVIFGINDTLRPGFDPEQIERSAAHTVGALRAAGAEVLTMRLPDAGRMLGLPGALARPLARRTQLVNAVLDAVSARFGTLHFDAAGTPATYDKQMWAVDRLHPNERGHRMIARSFHGLLAAAGHQLGPAPDAEPANPPPTRLAEFGWMATKGTVWVLRRSTDLVPYLLAMAVAELVCSARRKNVGGQLPEHLAQIRDLLVTDAVAQPLVEAERGGTQRQEHLVACGSEAHDVDAPVRWIPVTADQPGALHRIEVMGQGGFPDPDRVG